MSHTRLRDLTAWLSLAIGGGLVGLSCPSLAADITLHPVLDAPIFGGDGGVSGIDFASHANGAGYTLFVGTNGTGSPRRSLLQFDFSALPPGATVTAAALRLALDRIPNDSSQVLALHVLNAAWTTGNTNSDVAGTPGQGVPASAGDVTWNYASWPGPSNVDGVRWTQPGGDFSSTVSASSFVGPLGANNSATVYVWQSQGMVDDVNHWLRQPSTNHGWILTGNEHQTQSVKRFISNEARDSNGQLMSAELRPQLLLTYTIGPISGGGSGGGNAETPRPTSAPWGKLRRRVGVAPPVPHMP